MTNSFFIHGKHDVKASLNIKRSVVFLNTIFFQWLSEKETQSLANGLASVLPI